MNVINKLKELETELSGDQDSLNRLAELAKLYSGDDEVVSSEDIADLMKNEPEEIKMFSGIDKLDDILGGFRPQQLIVLTGITKHGKTTFAMELVEKLKEHKPLVIPLEEPARELIQKYQEREMEVPLFYTPLTSKLRTLEWIEEKIIESKAKHGTKIVFIDHLGYLRAPQANLRDNKADRTEEMMQEIKTMAKRWDVIIVLLAHLKKTQLDRNPDLEDIRGSASVAQEADTVLIMWRKTERENGEVVITNQATLSVQANRRTGKTGNIHLAFVNGRYVEDISYKHEDQAEESWNGI